MNAAGARARPSGKGQDAEQAAIRLLLVDDSVIARSVLSRMILSNSGFEIVGQASNAAEALAMLDAVRVDIVLLDIEMPGATGLEALPEILLRGSGARVLILSSLSSDGTEASVRALALGATDTLPKPGTGSFGGRFSEVLAERLRRIGRAARDEEMPAAGGAPIRLRAVDEHKLGCLALGASTGGLHALGEFLKALPPVIGAPILVTQHLPASFMHFFAKQIEAFAGRATRVAEEGMTLLPDEIVVASGEAHLSLRRASSRVVVEPSRDATASACLPSIDPMLEAAAALYGPAALGIIFSGMGRDGLAGCRRIVERGGTVMVQDKDSSAVWGMPRAVAEAGLASAVLTPAALAGRVAARLGGEAWS